MPEENTEKEAKLEVMSNDALAITERAQVDQQIATAKKYPRSIKSFMAEAQSMISLNQDVAEACNYKLKRTDKDGKAVYIEGPSIRLLEIAAAAYGNLRWGSQIVATDEDHVTARAFAFDLEKNNAVQVDVKRSIRTKTGRRYSADMITVTAMAASAIARRNALNGGAIPRAYVAELAHFAKQMALGDIKALPERRQRAFEYFTKTLGVPLAKVLTYLEKQSVEDCGIPELEDLQGLKTALKEGDTTLEDAFDPKPNTQAGPDLKTPAK